MELKDLTKVTEAEVVEPERIKSNAAFWEAECKTARDRGQVLLHRLQTLIDDALEEEELSDRRESLYGIED